MEKKLTWQEIQELHDQEWVELINYVWDEAEPYPESGVVRSHSKTRKGLSQQVRTNPVDDSAIVFVGDWKIPPNTAVNFNLHRVLTSRLIYGKHLPSVVIFPNHS